MSKIVYDFPSFLTRLYEYNGGSANSMIMGDSLVPSIYQNISADAKRSFLYETPDTGLNHSGWAVLQLNKALSSAPIRNEIKNVFISIGSNEVYTEIPASPLKKLAQNLKEKFPNAKYYTFRGEKGYSTAVDGGSDWFGKKIPNIDNAIESYYAKFPPLGINVLNTPPIYSVKHPGPSTPGIIAVAKEISKIVEGGTVNLTPAASGFSGSAASSGSTEDRPENIEHFQDWLDANKPGWAWGYPGGIVNKKGGYGKFGPRTTKAWNVYKDLYLKNPKGSQASITPIIPKVNPSSDITETDGKTTTSNCTIWTPKNVNGPVDVFVLYPGIKVGDKLGKEYMPPLVKNAVSDWFNKYAIVIPNKHTTPFENVKADLDAVLSKNKLSQKSLSVGIFSGSGNDSADITKYLGDLSLKNLILMDPTPGNNLTSAAKKLSSKGTGIYLMYNPKNWGDAGYYGGISGGSLYGPISKLATAVPNSDRVTTAHMNIPTEMLKKYKTQIERNLL
jgi:hypothetical protein